MVYAFFKLLLLHCFLGWVSLHISSLRAESPYPTTLYFSWMRSQWFSKPGVLGAHLSGAVPKSWGSLLWCTESLLFRETLCICEIPPDCRHHVGRGFFADIVYLPLLLTSMWLFRPLLWRSYSASFQFFFQRRCYISSCSLLCLWAVGGKFSMFLYQYLEPL